MSAPQYPRGVSGIEADGEGGFVLVAAVMVMLLVAMAGAAAVALADRSSRSALETRSQLKAELAADSAIDIAAYRMNKTIVGQGARGLVSLDLTQTLPSGTDASTGTLLENACVDVGLTGQKSVVSLASTSQAASGWCTADLSSNTQWVSLGDGAEFTSVSSLGVKVGGTLITRDIIGFGRSGGVYRRVIARYKSTFSNTVSTNARLFSRVGYAVCDGSWAPGDSITAGCPKLQDIDH